MSNFMSLRVADVIRNLWTIHAPFCVMNDYGFEENKTYFLVFSLGQDDHMRTFLQNSKKFNILYHGPPARNRGYGRMNRNTMFIFELKKRDGKSTAV